MKALLAGTLLDVVDVAVPAREGRPASSKIVAEILSRNQQTREHEVVKVVLDPSSIRPANDSKVFAVVDVRHWEVGGRSGLSVNKGFLFTGYADAATAAFGLAAVANPTPAPNVTRGAANASD